MDFYRYENESEGELIYRICGYKDDAGYSWQEISDILNKLLDHQYHKDTYRKQYEHFRRIFEANQNKFMSVDAMTDTLRVQEEALKKERYKLQTEKLEYNRWLRENARDELILEKITDAISALEPLEIPAPIEVDENEKSYLLAIADCHYGIEFELKDLFGNVLNAYSPEIFEKRMYQLLNEVVAYIQKENITKLNVWEMGDGIQGMLRLTSQLMKLRYGIIDSAINYGHYLATWLNELSKYVVIDFQIVMDSNHNQLRLLGAPKNAFPEENVSKIILALIKERLSNNPNINIIDNPTGFNFGMMSGYTVLGIHGEVKNLAKAIGDFSTSYNTNIDYMVGAHVHHSSVTEVGMDSETIAVRSVIGVDPYGLSINKVSNAGCSLLTFEEGHGLTCERKIKLF